MHFSDWYWWLLVKVKRLLVIYPFFLKVFLRRFLYCLDVALQYFSIMHNYNAYFFDRRLDIGEMIACNLLSEFVAFQYSLDVIAQYFPIIQFIPAQLVSVYIFQLLQELYIPILCVCRQIKLISFYPQINNAHFA